MQKESAEYLKRQYQPSPRISTSEWAARNIDFARVPNYDTPRHAPFDPDYAIYMRQVLDWLDDYTTREIWIRKCSRAAATEYVLAFMRRVIVEKNQPTYYLTANQLTTERFMENRIKRGMKLCPAADAEYKRARVTEHDIRFPGMDLRVAWPNARGAFKQDGWSLIVGDEFSTWKASAPDMLRKRAGTYAFHKIVGLSSPDPEGRHPDGDPVILEYEQTDRCLWMMPDPKTGNLFTWTFGGLRWPDSLRDAETGDWNLKEVRRQAYYKTPDGTRIENNDRMTVNRTGKWVPQNPDADERIHGIWVTGPMVPFPDGDFGTLAYRFLTSKIRGNTSLRAYFFENWADTGDMPNSDTVQDNSLRSRELNYARGGKFWEATDSQGEPQIIISDNSIKGLLMTVDVQKYHLYWIARWWVVSGDRTESGLEEWGNVASFPDLMHLVEAIQPSAGGVDIGYEGRYGETADFCTETGFLALMGDDNLKQDLYLRENLDPREGRKGQKSSRGETFSMLTWSVDVFRGKLMAALRGETQFGWHVPKFPGRPYVRQVLSTHKVDGEWIRKKGHPDDHMFDCEAMQLALARFYDSIQ
jgi:hypothetical protein